MKRKNNKLKSSNMLTALYQPPTILCSFLLCTLKNWGHRLHRLISSLLFWVRPCYGRQVCLLCSLTKIISPLGQKSGWFTFYYKVSGSLNSGSFSFNTTYWVCGAGCCPADPLQWPDFVKRCAIDCLCYSLVYFTTLLGEKWNCHWCTIV